MQYVSTGDLVTRWKYTRQGINRWRKKPEFPKPAFYVNNGRLPVWELAAIELFEQGKPELGNPVAKQSKIRGYAIALQKGTPKRGSSEN